MIRLHPPLVITEKLFDFVLPIAQASAISIKRATSWTGLFVTNVAQVLIAGHRQENHVVGMDLPNLRGSFDLAGSCVCPDCMTLGKAKQITKLRKIKKQQRDHPR